MIARLVDLSIRPLWAEMAQVGADEEADIVSRNRRYRFVQFRRIKMVRLEFED